MRTLLVSALVASASAASAFYEASEYVTQDVPLTDLVVGDCSANAQAFLAVSAPGKECDLDKVKGDLSALIKLLADRAINMLRENTDYARKGDAVLA